MVAHPLHDDVSNALVGFRFAAARELVEETGVSTTELDFTTVVEFELAGSTTCSAVRTADGLSRAVGSGPLLGSGPR
jgi:8-oxo-dGTP pyrophosphatase MutT (NUDIX family)